jgi:hypothetical protein
MINFNDTPMGAPRPNDGNAVPPVRPSLTLGRWTSRKTHPRLISFSGGEVSLRAIRR